MYKLKISKELSDILYKELEEKGNQKEVIVNLQDKIDRALNRIDDAVDRNEVEKQTVIKKNNKLNKIFKKILNLNISKRTEEKLSKEIKKYVISNGYIQLDNGKLTCKNHKLLIRR